MNITILQFSADAALLSDSYRSQTINYTNNLENLQNNNSVKAASQFGGFGPTLPICHYEKRWVECGSPLPGFPTPMCLEWIQVCKFPGSSRNIFQ